MKGSAPYTVFVTVGTTKFEDLIEVISSDEVLQVLLDKGFQRVLVQYGNGSRVPFASRPSSNTFKEKLLLECYRLKPSLDDDMKNASLVVSHSGYGCLVEALNLCKPVVAVINASLMDNHQTDIADELARKNHLARCTPQQLAATLKTLDLNAFDPLPPANPQGYVDHITKMMGF